MSDKRRPESVVRYKHVISTKTPPASSLISSSLPMAAMFMRNKIIAWSALFVALQTFLSESPASKASAAKASGSTAQPASMTVLIAVIALLTCYADFIFPQKAIIKKMAEAAAEASTTALSS